MDASIRANKPRPPIPSKPQNISLGSPKIELKRKPSPPYKKPKRTASFTGMAKNSQGKTCTSLKEEGKSPTLSPATTTRTNPLLGTVASEDTSMQLEDLQDGKGDAGAAKINANKNPVDRTSSVEKKSPEIRARTTSLTHRPLSREQDVKTSPLSTRRAISPTSPTVLVENRPPSTLDDELYQIPDPDYVNVSADDDYEIPTNELSPHETSNTEPQDDVYQIPDSNSVELPRDNIIPLSSKNFPQGEDTAYKAPDLQSVKMVQKQMKESLSTPFFNEQNKEVAPTSPRKLSETYKNLPPPPITRSPRHRQVDSSVISAVSKRQERKQPLVPTKSDSTSRMREPQSSIQQTEKSSVKKDAKTKKGVYVNMIKAVVNSHTQAKNLHPPDTEMDEEDEEYIHPSQFVPKKHSNSCPVPPALPPRTKTRVTATTSMPQGVPVKGVNIDLELTEEDEEDYIDMSGSFERVDRVMSDSRIHPQTKRGGNNLAYSTERQRRPNFTNYSNRSLGNDPTVDSQKTEPDDDESSYETIDLTRPIPPPRRKKKQAQATFTTSPHSDTSGSKKNNKLASAKSLDLPSDNYVIMHKAVI